ncbi:MAG: hypothetical protein AB8I58_08090 [Anaerolineales bacterium]
MNSLPIFTTQDRKILRDLARQVAEIADDPVMEERRQLWSEHNSLRSSRPMMLVFPEGSWIELIPQNSLQCQSEWARAAEMRLRQMIYTYDHFQDDTVVEKEWQASEWWQQDFFRDTGWGIEIERQQASDQRGAFAFKPVIRERADLKKLRYPEVVYDQAAHERAVEGMHDLFGDILEVKKTGIKHVSFHMMMICTGWLGLENILFDMIDRPEFVHEVMRFLESGYHNWLDQLEEMNLLSLNNDNTYQSTGGNGYTTELPAPDFDPQQVRTIDMWGSSESQEFQVVSPKMHAEFALQYEKRLLARFGLNGYGCCEDLSKKLDEVFTIPNLRRISISPFADVDVCAPKLKGDYIFSWKPHPAHLVGEFNQELIRDDLRHTVELAHQHGNVLEIILKDTHTCEHHPERFDRWTQICRQVIDEF